MLSKRTASSFYETPCPQCGYMTEFVASQLVAREFRSAERDYNVIGTDVKCQMCLTKFTPTRHRPANFFTNAMKEYLMSPLQLELIGQMKSYSAKATVDVNGVRLGQRTEELKYMPKFDNISVFFVDELG